MRRVKAFVVVGFLILSVGILRALEMSGVNVPPEHSVGGQTVKLNGAGIRTATILRVKVYVAGFYSPSPVHSEEEVLALAGPYRFDFTFLRGFGKEKVTEAWDFTFEQSASFTYPQLKQDQKVFVEAFGPIKKLGVESVEIEGDETRVYDDGVLKAAIKGRNFQKTFLSLWFGSKPVMKELKGALLGKK